MAYFIGAVQYGLQHSGVISLVLLNETGYYCVEKPEAESCERAKQELASRPVREKKTIVRYSDTLINNYNAMHAQPTQ
jgi:hypothetical protein